MARKVQSPKDFVPSWPYSPDAPYWNEGTPWDDMQLHDLIWELNRGDTVEEIAVSSDIRGKMEELGLKEKKPASVRVAKKAPQRSGGNRRAAT
jgi:hypothetical protein